MMMIANALIMQLTCIGCCFMCALLLVSRGKPFSSPRPFLNLTTLRAARLASRHRLLTRKVKQARCVSATSLCVFRVPSRDVPRQSAIAGESFFCKSRVTLFAAKVGRASLKLPATRCEMLK